MEASPLSVPLLSLRGTGKSYAVPVLVDIDLDFRAGEVHALVGANGAGKSTLARIISGLTLASTGTMRLDGTPYAPAGKAEAEAQGVQMVMQELNLVETLSVAENLFLGHLPHRLGLIDTEKLNGEAEKALAAVGLEHIDPRMPVSQLGVGMQQLVEIAAALVQHCRFLILDEPTAALTDPQIDLLFEKIRELKGVGVGVLYISHRMEELQRISDHITVLRDGRWIATRKTPSLTHDEIVHLMVGEEAQQQRPPQERTTGRVLLRVEGLSRGKVLQDIRLEVRAGEILGLAGLVGSGRTELLRAIFGADPIDGGAVALLGGQSGVFSSPAEAVQAGIGMIPEDRKQQGLLLPLSIRANTVLASLPDVANRAGWIDERSEVNVVAVQEKVLDIVATSMEQPVEELSGGNQQKVVMARWLLADCQVLLFDEPTRGIDIAARQMIYAVLNELAQKGKGLLVVSSDLEELMSISDRIAVLSAGKLVRTYEKDTWTHDAIMKDAISGYLTPIGST